MGRGGLDQIEHRWLSQQEDEKGVRDMVTEEVHNLEEETRKTHASRFSKQCAWTGWDQVEPKKISRPILL